MMKNLKGLIPSVLAAVIVAGAAQAAVWQWSKTAGTNATADPSINWAEGMSPSSVNDSARAMMARLAEWRDDTSGVLATGGTSTAYTLTSNSGLNSVPTDGQLIAFTPHATNGVAATLRVDGGTIYAIQTSPGNPVAAGVLVQGTPYTAKFNLSATAWILRDYFGNPFNVPLGAVLDYTGTTAPNSNFVLANGQCISRTTYAAYFALVGTVFNSCDGVSTFGVPDLANRVVAGTQMGGTSRISVAGGNFDGNVFGNTGGFQFSILSIAQLPVHTPTGSVTGLSGTVSTATGSLSGTINVSVSDPGHTHTTPGIPFNKNGQATGFTTSGGQLWWGDGGGGTSGSSGTGLSGTVNLASGGVFTGNSQTVTGGTATFTGNSIGSGSAHSVLPPMMVLTKIVRVF